MFATARFRALALNAAAGQVPDWIELLPAGPTIEGRDGRQWTLSNPEAVIAATASASKPFPVDWEHATELAAPRGEPAPAAGWVDTFEVRDGAIWGQVQWTPRARQQIADREYRFISPVFLFDPESGEIMRLVNAALTNRPNLDLTALNTHDSRLPFRHRRPPWLYPPPSVRRWGWPTTPTRPRP